MKKSLSSVITGFISLVGIGLNTLFWCTPLYLITLLKLVIPIPAWRRACSRVLTWIAESWIEVNSAIFRATQPTEWDVRGVQNLKQGGWYLVTANHISWTDIFVLQRVFNRRIPFLRFFLKQELIWFPMLGLAWWALDFPFMKRYSRAYLKKHPEKKGEDLETTRRACEKYQNFPVSVINFLEGTRFTPAKHAKQESPHTHLLRPKAGGIAFVLSAMGEMFDAILDVTIVYPEGNPTFWDFVSGQIPRVVVDVRQIPVDPAFVEGDYTGDAVFRAEFQAWVRDLWAEKDEIIEEILREEDGVQTPEEETAVSQPDQLPTP